MARELKVGMILWSVSGDAESVSSIEEWVIRSIKREPKSRVKWLRQHITEQGKIRVYVIQKNSSTWVKKSRKHFDYGWDNNIPEYYRKSFTLEDYEANGLPHDLSFSKAGAYTNHIRMMKSQLKRTRGYRREDLDEGVGQEDIKEWDETIILYEKYIKRMKGLRTKEKNKTKGRKNNV